MLERHVIVRRKRGIHLRPAQEIVNLTGQFACEVFLRNGEYRVNAKSIMGILGLAAAEGHELTITTDGVDEADAMTVIFDLIDGGFPNLKEDE